jgi:hypothetical protein
VEVLPVGHIEAKIATLRQAIEQANPDGIQRALHIGFAVVILLAILLAVLYNVWKLG